MTQFYQDLVVNQSWQLLKKLARRFKFVLIGGWAVWLYTKTLKSKDIDLIVGLDQLAEFKRAYEMLKNDRLKKYEIKTEGVDIDLYVPFYSNPGLKAEEILKYTEKREGFTLCQKEVLFITKQKAFAERKTTIKGKKDLVDIISLLLLADFDFALYRSLLEKHDLMVFQSDLLRILEETKEVKDLNLNRHYFSRKKKEILKRLSS